MSLSKPKNLIMSPVGSASKSGSGSKRPQAAAMEMDEDELREEAMGEDIDDEDEDVEDVEAEQFKVNEEDVDFEVGDDEVEYADEDEDFEDPLSNASDYSSDESSSSSGEEEDKPHRHGKHGKGDSDQELFLEFMKFRSAMKKSKQPEGKTSSSKHHAPEKRKPAPPSDPPAVKKESPKQASPAPANRKPPPPQELPSRKAKTAAMEATSKSLKMSAPESGPSDQSKKPKPSPASKRGNAFSYIGIEPAPSDPDAAGPGKIAKPANPGAKNSVVMNTLDALHFRGSTQDNMGFLPPGAKNSNYYTKGWPAVLASAKWLDHIAANFAQAVKENPEGADLTQIDPSLIIRNPNDLDDITAMILSMIPAQ